MKNFGPGINSETYIDELGKRVQYDNMGSCSSPRFPLRNKRFSAKVAVCVSEKLYESLLDEFDVFPLTPENYKRVLKYSDIDFVLFESNLSTVTGHWPYSQLYYDEKKKCSLSHVIKYTKSLGIPAVYWNTKDLLYFNHYFEISKKFDRVYYSDERARNESLNKGVEAGYLPPCFQAS